MHSNVTFVSSYYFDESILTHLFIIKSCQENKCPIKIAKEGIRTRILWCPKQPL